MFREACPMSDVPLRPREPEHLLCDTCMKEIPYTVALTNEGPDYILHFCGLECLGKWEQRRDRVIETSRAAGGGDTHRGE
jgi:hypothetical protein